MLRLRPFKNCDAKYIVSWIKDEYAFRQWCADRFENYPITADDMIKKYADCAEADDFFEMTALDDCEVIGHLIMRFLDKEKTILRFGFVILNNAKRGQGYGKEMLLLALKYAFEILKVQKVTLGVFENNPAAYWCYKAAGFQEVEGERSEHYRVLNEDWKCIELEAKKAAPRRVNGDKTKQGLTGI